MDRDEIQARVAGLYEAFSSGDLERYRETVAESIVWHVPGDNPVSGRYRGTGEYFGTMVERMSPLDEWKFTVGRILVNERDRAALVAFHLEGARKGRRVSMDGFHMVRLDEAGRVTEGWGFTEDQAALDEFFSA